MQDSSFFLLNKSIPQISQGLIRHPLDLASLAHALAINLHGTSTFASITQKLHLRA